MELHEIDVREAKNDVERYAILFNLCLIGGLTRNTTNIKIDYNGATTSTAVHIDNLFLIIEKIQRYEFNVEHISMFDNWFPTTIIEPTHLRGN